MVCPHHLASSTIAWFRRKEMLQISEGAKLGVGIDKDRFSISGDHTIGDFNLQINDVMNSDFGQYVCTVVIEDTSVQIIFNLVLKKAPKGLNIYAVNTSKNKSNTFLEESTKVTVTENETIKLYCNISSGIPEGTLEWVYRGNVIQSGGPGSTRLMLKSTHTNSGQYNCRTNSSVLDTPLTKSIEILVQYKPKVTLSVGNAVRIIEGNSLNVYCNVDSSPEVQSVSWLIQNNGETRKYGDGRVLQIAVITRRDTGVYICKATNMVGSTMVEASVIVMYAPDVTIVYENYTVNAKSRKLVCLPKGVPANYTFVQWQHKSEYGDHIRFLDGSEDGILLLPKSKDFNSQYYDNGVYVCTVSNGIPGVSGNSSRAASVYLSISGKPMFVEDNRRFSYGVIKESVEMIINIFSNPKYSDIFMHKQNGEQLISDKSNFNIIEEHTFVNDTFYNSNVRVKGYRMTVKIAKLRPEMIQKYTLNLQNEFGQNHYDISLFRASVPRIPMNLTLSTKEGNVLVDWIRNFDGGLKQTFFIEFRESNSKKWTVVQSLNMTEGDMLSWTIERLQTKTTYNFRMFAQNRLGRSNSTKEKSIIVGNEKLKSSLAIFSTIPVAVSTSIILFMIILVVSVIVLWKRMVKPKNRVDSPLEHEEDNHYVEIEPNGMRELSINQTGNTLHGQKVQEHVLGGDQDRRSLDNVSSSSTDTDSKDHISLTSGISGNTTNPKDIYARRYVSISIRNDTSQSEHMSQYDSLNRVDQYEDI
ncbi:synaptogenesis protein syg-2-like [Mytilus edulis]|uniref:synaptogenesis protein syg-2-like n=1 Tax=Mytilus edulis TaxID=6550 RepID=UPI0039EE2378